MIEHLIWLRLTWNITFTDYIVLLTERVSVEAPQDVAQGTWLLIIHHIVCIFKRNFNLALVRGQILIIIDFCYSSLLNFS